MLDVSYIMLAFNPLEEAVSKPLTKVMIAGREVVISSDMLMITISACLLMIFLPIAVRGRGLVRKGFGNLIETICLYLRDEMVAPILGIKTEKFMHFIWTTFFFYFDNESSRNDSDRQICIFAYRP